MPSLSVNPESPSLTENGAVLCADEMTPSNEDVHVSVNGSSSKSQDS